ncbi:MAG: hypothetical protein RLZZ339_3353, partial [Cyanobacteriota bacterium]
KNKLRFEKDTKLHLICLSKGVSLILINHLQSRVGANHRMKMDNYLSKIGQFYPIKFLNLKPIHIYG